MRTTLLLASVFAVATGRAAADDGKSAKPAEAAPARSKPTVPDGLPAEQVKSVIRQYDEARAEFTARYKPTASEAEQETIFEKYFPIPDDYAALLVQIAQKHPKDPATFDALLWTARYSSKRPNQPESPYARAKTMLVRDYLDDAKIGPFCLALRHDSEDPTTPEILRHVWTKNSDKSARAQAGFILAATLLRRAQASAAYREMAPAQLAQFEKVYGKETVAALRELDADATRKEAVEVLERLTTDKDYVAVVADFGTRQATVGDLAGRQLFEIRALQPGRPAPEIAGEDIDGVPFKLSDYRGKVIVLDFWGHW